MSKEIDELTAKARAFARLYVAMVEALMQEGVPEDVARFEARMVAISLTVPKEREKPDWS